MSRSNLRRVTVEEAIADADPSLTTTGESEGWRWAIVGDWVALDNRPMVDAVARTEVPPQYQSVIAPLEVLEAATARRRFVHA